ncbi:MAG TPA: hypothetical protein VKU00_18070 [Chthonomonadaceae bacterium]|nr:hypothetical protein [Chthonomonadaceae bacterium]
MSYVFRGSLCGYICTECPEPLTNVTVRLYRSRPDQDVTVLAVANPKNTLALLTEDAVNAKAAALIAETATNADGTFTFELGDKENYTGQAFEVDVYCGSVPHQIVVPNPPPPPRQFSITTLQPMWKPTETGFVWGWNYCIPETFWCPFRGLFGARVICGLVTTCDTQTPLAGVTVTAFDADLLSDDPLGSGTTDANGKFRIDYFHNSFLQALLPGLVPLFPHAAGADVHFRVETAGGIVLLDEPHSRGRQPDRDGVGVCFCVELCVDEQQPGPSTYPWFTNVGDFNIYSDIDATTGKTKWAAPVGFPTAHGGPNFGFYDGINGYGLKLIGFCPKTHPVGGQPMRYRFLYEHPANPGVKVPLTGSRISAVEVGSRPIMWNLFGPGPVSTFQTIIIAGSGATPDPTPIPVVPPGTPWGPVPAHVIVPDANGWVIIDQTALDGGFYGPLVRFVSSTAVPGGAVVGPGDAAGVAPVSPKNGVALKIYFEAEPVGGPTGGATTLGNNLDKILINNWPEVSELDLQQFSGGNCCTPLDTTLDILYTADHELMLSWGVSMSSCASSLGWAPPALPGGSGPRGGNGTASPNISGWPACSYRVDLSTTRAVTDGEADDPGETNELTFCICR